MTRQNVLVIHKIFGKYFKNLVKPMYIKLKTEYVIEILIRCHVFLSKTTLLTLFSLEKYIDVNNSQIF